MGTCWNCQATGVKTDHRFCHSCGFPAKETSWQQAGEPDVYDQYQQTWTAKVPPVSSSGRDGLDPVSRARFLEGLRRPPEERAEVSWLGKITEAEDAYTKAKTRTEDTWAEVVATRAAFPEWQRSRTSDLSPDARARFTAWRKAEADHQEAERAEQLASERASRLLAGYEKIAGETQTAVFGDSRGGCLYREPGMGDL